MKQGKERKRKAGKWREVKGRGRQEEGRGKKRTGEQRVEGKR